MTGLIDVTDPADGRIVAEAWLARAESVHRQLRPQLPADYVARMHAVFGAGGRMLVASTTPADVGGVAVWRCCENTAYGRFAYVDDLVTDALRRSTGIGHALIEAIATRARSLGCTQLILDSGTQRQRAHAFYFREGMTITSFHFGRPL